SHRWMQGSGLRAVSRLWVAIAARAAMACPIPAVMSDETPFRAESESGPSAPFVSLGILYSVGSYSRPNHWEEQAADLLLAHLEQTPVQRRPLLVVPAAPQPAARFLRALVSLSPGDDRQYVIASGDSIDFNSIYRDRNLAWPIQDIPMTLVTFCQRNPVD